ncbi:hypothetical protein DES41_10545 [Pseudorhodoferax soli]|uniref:Uncharacterized protein n=1 Tax=Pseudorhodoferax soli TaxID=545864 RepID=A0A368XRE9_9BURK|nr:hypothetical protein DES41_10545 [Pseudorhodoferax soli]
MVALSPWMTLGRPVRFGFSCSMYEFCREVKRFAYA